MNGNFVWSLTKSTSRCHLMQEDLMLLQSHILNEGVSPLGCSIKIELIVEVITKAYCYFSTSAVDPILSDLNDLQEIKV